MSCNRVNGEPGIRITKAFIMGSCLILVQLRGNNMDCKLYNRSNVCESMLASDVGNKSDKDCSLPKQQKSISISDEDCSL